MDQLTRKLSQMALRLMALPPEASRNDLQALDVIEQLALDVLSEVAARRGMPAGDPRESRGTWCIPVAAVNARRL